MGDYVVTGSSSGIGAATAARLCAAGHRVIGVDSAHAQVQADLGTPEGRQSAVKQIEELASTLDGYLAFAGIGPEPGRSGADVVSINYFGAVDVFEGIAHLLTDGASAVFISSTATTTQPGWPVELSRLCLEGTEAAARNLADSYGEHSALFAYPASKAALAYYARISASEFGDRGIRLNAIAPGFIDSAAFRAARQDPELGETLDIYEDMIPAARTGQPDEVASVAEFLIGPGATYIVGAVIFVDGGLDARLRTTDWPRPVRAVDRR